MDFVDPFKGKTPGDPLSNQEIISAVRLSLCAEEEATHLYNRIAEFVPDERVKKLMIDVAKEEQVHIGEFQKLEACVTCLSVLLPDRPRRSSGPYL